MSKTYRRNKKGEEYQDKDRRNQKWSRSCLHHGGCPWCESGRLHGNERRKPIQEKDYEAT